MSEEHEFFSLKEFRLIECILKVEALKKLRGLLTHKLGGFDHRTLAPYKIAPGEAKGSGPSAHINQIKLLEALSLLSGEPLGDSFEFRQIRGEVESCVG